MKVIHALGKFGEESAAAYLKTQGFHILNNNWRYGHLEIDLICQLDNTIIFVEVKTRRRDIHGGAVGAITLKKILNISKAAQAWLKIHNAWLNPCRFDVICITGSPSKFSLQHYPDAFPYVPSLDSRNTHWQY